MNDHSRVKVEIDVLLSDFCFGSGKTSGKKVLKIVFEIIEIKSLLKSFHVNEFPFSNVFQIGLKVDNSLRYVT